MIYSPSSRLSPILLLVLGLLSLTGMQGQAQAGLFGYPDKEFATDHSLFPKWEDMLKRALSEGPNGPDCNPSRKKCQFQTLQKVLPKLKKLPANKQLEFVHKFVNRLEYITDMSNYGLKDYWATQHEMYGHDGGDCDDYAITKYYALKMLGFDVNDLRVVVVKDTNLNIGHAILVVNFKGKSIVLDNRIKTLINANRLHHLQPIYAINEDAWWRFRKPS